MGPDPDKFFHRCNRHTAGTTRFCKLKCIGSMEGWLSRTIILFLLLFYIGCKCMASDLEATQRVTLKIDASPNLARKIPDTLLGVFFEEMGRGGAGGLWAELVSNRDGKKLSVPGKRGLGTSEIVGIIGPMMASDILSFSSFLRTWMLPQSGYSIVVILLKFVKSITLFGRLLSTDGLFHLKTQDTLDSLEFARGSANSSWGSVRAAMGHPEPFPVKYVAIGNEDCGKKFYNGNYLKFYSAIREAYPDIQLISNCDGSSGPLDHPADLYDYHVNFFLTCFFILFLVVYADAKTLFSMKNTFDKAPRSGPKAFVSEYAVWKTDAGRGTLLASLAEAAFLTGLENNSDVVEMACHAPLFVNDDIEKKWNPDVIVFNTWQYYGTPSYWMHILFRESSGAVLHPIEISSSSSVWASLSSGSSESRTLCYTMMQIVPVKSQLFDAAAHMQVKLAPHSFTSFDLALASSKHGTLVGREDESLMTQL
nr:unnamed protein product [Digitaria exilis]